MGPGRALCLRIDSLFGFHLGCLSVARFIETEGLTRRKACKPVRSCTQIANKLTIKRRFTNKKAKTCPCVPLRGRLTGPDLRNQERLFYLMNTMIRGFNLMKTWCCMEMLVTCSAGVLQPLRAIHDVPRLQVPYWALYTGKRPFLHGR